MTHDFLNMLTTEYSIVDLDSSDFGLGVGHGACTHQYSPPHPGLHGTHRTGNEEGGGVSERVL